MALPMQHRKVILNHRDQAILVSLFKNKLLTLEQVHRLFFPNRARVTANIRMNKIFRAGYIEKKSIFLKNSNQTYFEIKPLGIDFIKDHLNGDVAFKNYKSDSLIHDLNLVDISQVFLNFKSISEIYYESEILSYSHESLDDDLNPFLLLRTDRVLSILGPKGSILVPLEYERTLKRSHRLVSKLRDYYLNEDIPIVFYICEDKRIIKELVKADAKACDGAKSKVYFCELKDVQSSNHKIIFENSLGQKRTFK
jgi:hypothetical protein